MPASKYEPRVAMLSSYVPRRCGIATFCHNLSDAICRYVTGGPISDEGNLRIVAMNDQQGHYHYPSEVAIEVDQHRRDAYVDAAEIINSGRIQAVCIQHEFGLFGGESGEYLLDFVDKLRLPVVPTLHTVLTSPSEKQRVIINRLAAVSPRIVVMAEKAREILENVYGIPAGRISIIPHGVPDVPLSDTEPFKERFGLSNRPVILTFGLLSPGKSIEVALDAVARITKRHPDVAYVILGVTHPGVRRENGEQYRLFLQSRAAQLGIQNNVVFKNHYVSDEDLREYLQAADVYVTPYKAREQITSGTLAYALAAGKPIVSTPYWHAAELLADGRGRLFDFGNSEELAGHLDELLTHDRVRQSISKAAYEHGRQMTWPRVAESYVQTFRTAMNEHAHLAAAPAHRQVLLRMSLPEPRLDHLDRLTDDTGILQHAVMATPNRAHGYCTDDNARALIVAAMSYHLFRDEKILPKLDTYLSFLHYAQPAGGGRFRNFMSYDRRWFDQDGSDDCQGRTLWALGYLVGHAPEPPTEELGVDLFRQGLAQADTLVAPRSWAFTVLGLYHYLRRWPEDTERRNMLDEFATRISRTFTAGAGTDWPWFEDTVTYDNGRLPQALIAAGLTLDRPDMVRQGLDVLRWLLDVQRAEDGCLSIIGNQGWLSRHGQRARYDQQPLEAAALIGACKAAYKTTSEKKWLVEMRRCFEWYVGRNDASVALVDFRTRGCCDGLHDGALNRNQGAESTLCWYLSLLIMHEMQGGEPLDAA